MFARQAAATADASNTGFAFGTAQNLDGANNRDDATVRYRYLMESALDCVMFLQAQGEYDAEI